MAEKIKSTIDKSSYFGVVVIGIISGLTSFLFLAVLNFLIGQLLAGTYTSVNPAYILVFILVILSFIWSRKVLTVRMIHLSQTLFWKIRSQILSITLRADYEQMSKYKEKIQSALTFDVNVMTQGALNSIQFLTSFVVVIACLVYMALESVPLFFVTLGIAVLGVGVYLLRVSKNNKQFLESRELEDGFMKYFNALLFGVKEIQLDGQKGKSIYNDKIVPIAQKSYDRNTKAFTGFLHNQMIGQILFYALIASIVVYFSVILDIDVTTTVNFLFILLYLLGAIETIMVLLPGLMQALVSAKRVEALKTELLVSLNNESTENFEPKRHFTQIKITELIYEYDAASKEEGGFQIGPISWNLNQGEIAFVHGGNGSGKTTFVHSILGLLKIQKGTIEMDQEAVSEENSKHYKSMFAAVFNDFYLFDEFYGNEHFDKQKAVQLIEMFEMNGKVEVVEKGFSVTNLSTGQRKRLALIAAVLEEKPIIVLDEWAADQDPHFRKKFYEEILPYLKREGFTILAITHDDRYYHCADKIYKMEFGKLSDETQSFKNTLISE